MSLTIRKRGKYWYARGTVAARKADGSIGRIRIEESTRTESKARAREIAGDIERHYHDLAYGRLVKRGPTFAEASLTYLQTRGKPDRFLPKLLGYFGDTPISEIDQAAIAEAAHSLYPGASASSHIRAVYSPVVTIMRLSGLRPDFRRPKAEKPSLSIPPDEWFDSVLPHCPPRLAALLICLTLTGRRLGELLELKEGAIDHERGTITIGRTKTGESVVVSVPRLALALLRNPPDRAGRRSKRLFGYSDRGNVYRALERACDAAGVIVRNGEGEIVEGWYGTHALGRHAFASRLLKEGRSLKHVQDAGGWKTIKMVAERYGHLEQREVDRDVKELGDKWGKARKLLPQNPSKTAKNVQ